MTVTHGTITANDLTYEHIDCIVSITHKVVVVNPDGPTHKQVHDYELDMLDYADKVAAHDLRIHNALQNDQPYDPTPPARPADLPALHIEQPAETTGPLNCFTQTEDIFYLTVGGSQIVVERYDYLTVKATPFDSTTAAAEPVRDDWRDPEPWLYPNGTRTAHALPHTACSWSPRTREQYDADTTPATATERFANVQRSKEHNKPAGTISWAEHVEAWEAYNKAWRGTGQDAEMIDRRGGFGYSELIQFLGHEPKTWKAAV